MLVAARKFEYRAPDLSLEEVRHLLCSFLLHAGNKCVNVGYRKANQPTQTDNEGMSALHISAKQGHVNVMEQIISHKPDACDLVDNRGWNLLHVAVANAKLNVVRFILKTPRLESLINAADNEGNTPLHVAAGRDKYRIITILVNEIKVHKKAQNHNFQKPIDLIRTNPNIGELYKASDSLAFYCSSASVFLQFCAASEHNYHLLLRFTKVSATLTYISSLGMVVAFTSALHAVMPGSSMLAYYTFVSDVMRLLLEEVMNLQKKRMYLDGLHCIVQHIWDILRQLKFYFKIPPTYIVMEEINAHNPDGCDLVDNREWTPLHAAITNEKLNAVRYILKKRMLESLIRAADNKGNMPLHVATRRDKYSIITILVNYLKVHKKAHNLNFKNIID
ncbi:hypothetical protein FEM48_Zijuj04G0195500 [Ziziphus jujuba var. spinosa]|uniref:PGG domain-containing protein n=1 Tax=Ziziphus jujuba var. spinosa TaxID=714518 RepID=A0A978VLS2_ZIZJJ|nr:hypothetical protein FEM48_Zijuj04G0195500 [Ziziphus jujuba var. spinosa]